jgi:hypothetical protein
MAEDSPALADWAQAHGHTRIQRDTSHTWLTHRPDLIDTVRQAREADDPWPWPTIHGFLKDCHLFPFSEGSLRDAGHRLGIR